MRMETSQNVSDRGSALTVRLVRCEALSEHRVDDPSVDRLHTVSDIGKRTVRDDRHRVVYKRFPHLAVKIDGDDSCLFRLEGLIHVSFLLQSGQLLIFTLSH